MEFELLLKEEKRKQQKLDSNSTSKTLFLRLSWI